MSISRPGSSFVHASFGVGALALVAAAGLSIPATSACAQQEGAPAWTGDMGITESVAKIMERAARTPKKPPVISDERDEDPDRSHLPQNPDSPFVPRWPYQAGDAPKRGHSPLPTYPNLAGQFGGVIDNPQSVTLNFSGVNLGGASGYPPDTQMAVGPTQILSCENGRLTTYSKTTGGPDGLLNVDMDSFFSSVRNGSSTSDPQVRYDRLSQRWFILIINVASSNNRFLLARSSGSNITSSSAFTFFFFQQNLVAPAGDTNLFADYPSLGIDLNALYTGANMFNSTFSTTAWVIQKSSVLGAGPIAATAFRGLLAGGNGPYSPRGVDNDDPAATEGYIIGPSNAVFGQLVMRRISNPGGAPTISSNLLIAVPATNNPINTPASGSTSPLAALDDRLFQATAHRNRLTGVRTITTAHNIQVNASGVASTSGGRNGSRWYQIGNLTGAPNLVQAGTLFDPAASNPLSYWIPSAAMSGQGHMALGCSMAGAANQAGSATAGRLATDGLGTIQAPTTLINGAGTYNVALQNGSYRWGDYSATGVDPNDDQTIWTAQEYCNGTNSFSQRIARLMAPPPATPASASPSVTQGDSNVDISVTGSVVNGSGFYDTEPGFNRMTATVNGGGVTVNSATLNSATQITLNVSVAANALTGPRTITVTNPDGQVATSASGILTINSGVPVCPTFSQQPEGGALCPGDQLILTVAATGNPPPTYQWQLNNADIPGATSTTYQVNSVTFGDGGSYTCIATNVCGSQPSNAALVTIGTSASISQQPQSLTVPAGAPAAFTVVASNATGYQWFKDNSPIGGATSASYGIASVVPGDAGVYTVTVTAECAYAFSDGATLTVSNAPACYANCDHSTDIPFLNVGDFTCFLQRYAANDPYANCDGSTTTPVLNVGDFTCFLQSYAAGCSAP